MNLFLNFKLIINWPCQFYVYLFFKISSVKITKVTVSIFLFNSVSQLAVENDNIYYLLMIIKSYIEDFSQIYKNLEFKTLWKQDVQNHTTILWQYNSWKALLSSTQLRLQECSELLSNTMPQTQPAKMIIIVLCNFTNTAIKQTLY